MRSPIGMSGRTVKVRLSSARLVCWPGYALTGSRIRTFVLPGYPQLCAPVRLCEIDLVVLCEWFVTCARSLAPMRQNQRSILGPGLLGLGGAVVHQPSVHGREQLPLAFAKPRVSIHSLNDAVHRLGLPPVYVSVHFVQGVAFQPKQLLHPSNRC